VIAEGFRLAPHLVKPLLAVRSHAERALRNLLERDAMFTHRLYEEAKRLELNTIEVDTTMTVDDLARRVAESFGL
jgi:chloramphenicol 3-O-phosphotransferase